jgi:hypothetical protein
MEGGIAVMKGILHKPRRFLSLIVVLALVSALMIASISYAQTKEKAPIATEFFKMTGRLQVLNLHDNWAQIDGLRWELADNFDKEALSRAWKKRGTVEFTEDQGVWVSFYVSLVTEASSDDVRRAKEEEMIRLITKPDTIQKIHDSGGKIYKIERLPA